MSTAFPKSVVTVTGPVSTSGDEDTFPTHVANRGWGGLHHADTVAEMNAITTERRMWGMQCIVYDDGTSSGKYVLRNSVLGGVDDDLSNNANWVQEIEANTGDLYVSSTFGIDEPTSGRINKPFKTIQYAIQQTALLAISGLNIIVRKGSYNYPDVNYPGVEHMHHDGTITFEAGATINVNLTDPTAYLIDNFQTVILGTSTLNLYSGRFLKNSTSINVRILKVTGATIISNQAGGLIDLQGTSNSPSNATISGTIFESCNFNRFTPSSGVTEIFVNEDFKGSYFNFSKTNFAQCKLTFKNYSFNGGNLFEDCGWYGQQTGVGQQGYIYMGKTNNVIRPMSFRRCRFDIQTVDDSLQGRAITITEANVVFNMAYCSFDRYPTNNKFSIWSDYNYGIIASNTFSGVPSGGIGTPTEYVTNGFQYVPNLPIGFSF